MTPGTGSGAGVGAVPATAADEATVLGLFRGVTVFRALALVWALVGVASSTEFLRHRWWGLALVALMVGWTALVSMWPVRGPFLPVRSTAVIVAELVIGVVVLIGDGLVYDPGRAISLAWSWPAAGIMVAGIAFGWRAGLASALIVVGANLFTEFRLDTNLSEPIQAFSRVGLWVATGLLAGYVASRLRRAEAEVSMVRAREEVTRTLHDGVLQTLAVIQRRSDDAELAALAREQEGDLRRFLAGAPDRPVAIEAELRRLAARQERLDPDTRVAVVVAPDTPEPGVEALDALLGAVGEALANAGKHAEAEQVTVYAEPADPDDLPSTGTVPATGAGPPTVFVSVRDDGTGFDPATAAEGIGLPRSIRARVEEVGGRAEITSRPGRGTDVKLWV